MPRRPEKKPEPAPLPTRRVLPMQLQVGDRVDETGEWEVVSRPYTSPGGKSTHAHVQRVGQAGRRESEQDRVTFLADLEEFVSDHREHGCGSRVHEVSSSVS